MMARSEEKWRDGPSLLLNSPPSFPSFQRPGTIRLVRGTKSKGRGPPETLIYPPSFVLSTFHHGNKRRQAAEGSDTRGPQKRLAPLFMGPLTWLRGFVSWRTSQQGEAAASLSSRRGFWDRGSYGLPPGLGPEHRWEWEAKHIVGINWHAAEG